MACNFCGQPANRHLTGCPQDKAPMQPTEEDLTVIVKCPACPTFNAKMYFVQMWWRWPLIKDFKSLISLCSQNSHKIKMAISRREKIIFYRITIKY